VSSPGHAGRSGVAVVAGFAELATEVVAVVVTVAMVVAVAVAVAVIRTRA
jgi:hypothetical protein